MSDDPLPEHFPSSPVIGDGIVTFPGFDNEEETMSVELPASMAQLLMTESAGNIQNTNLSGRNIANIAMGSLQAGVARTHNELDAVESRAVSGVMATPIAPPTTGGGT